MLLISQIVFSAVSKLLNILSLALSPKAFGNFLDTLSTSERTTV